MWASEDGPALAGGTPGRRRGRERVSAAWPARPCHAMPLRRGTGLPAGDGAGSTFQNLIVHRNGWEILNFLLPRNRIRCCCSEVY